MALIIIIIVSIGFLSGCSDTSSNDDSSSVNWEIVSCDREIDSFIFEYEVSEQQYSRYAKGISNVSLTIKNIGDTTTTYVIDFQFRTEELEKPTVGVSTYIWGKDKCPCDSVYGGITTSVYDQKQIVITSGQSRTITSSTNPNPFIDRVVREWCYQVTSI